VARNVHPKKEIEAALIHAEANGWTVVWSTPKNATNHGKALRRVVDNCSRNKAKE
jgi:hypothetical protein